MVYARRITKRRFRRRPRTQRAPTRRLKSKTSIWNGIPDRLFNKYHYATSITLSPGLAPAFQFYRNSMFDPDFTGIGHQPWLRDQISALYSRYRCYGFKYSITIQNTNPTDSVRWAIVPINHTGTPTNMDEAWEKPYSRSGLLTPDTGSKAMVTVSGYLSAAKVLGTTKAKFSTDDVYASLSGSNPTRQAYLMIACQAGNGTTSVDVRITAKLTMLTCHYQRATITGS